MSCRSLDLEIKLLASVNITEVQTGLPGRSIGLSASKSVCLLRRKIYIKGGGGGEREKEKVCNILCL